jgi:hypothetical protein
MFYNPQVNMGVYTIPESMKKSFGESVEVTLDPNMVNYVLQRSHQMMTVEKKCFPLQ